MGLSRRSTCLILGALFAATLARDAHAQAGDAALPQRWLSVISMSAHRTLLLQQADDAAKKAKSDDPLPDGKGKDVTVRLCSGCHAVTVFSTQRHDADHWNNIIDNMVSKGLSASDEELTTVGNYLATYLGPPADKPSDAAPKP
jgi:cytochrome c5